MKVRDAVPVRQCKDIPDQDVLMFIRSIMARAANLAQSATWYGGPDEFTPANSIVLACPPGTTGRLALAKCRSLKKRGLIEGCTCGCHGAFTLTAAGQAVLKGEPMKRPTFWRVFHMCEARGLPIGNGCLDPDLDAGYINLMGQCLDVVLSGNEVVLTFGRRTGLNGSIVGDQVSFSRTKRGWQDLGHYLLELKSRPDLQVNPTGAV